MTEEREIERPIPVSAGFFLSNLLPTEGIETDYCSLQDLVITGLEVEWFHMRIRKYDPDASGKYGSPWAIVQGLGSAYPDGGVPKVVSLDEDTMRDAVSDWVNDRIHRGWPSQTILASLQDPDAVIADGIVQFALYGEEVFG